MNSVRLMAIVKKEIRHIVREPKTLAAAFLIPIFLILLFCDSLSLDVDRLPVAVMDNDNTAQSREFIKKLTAGGYFVIHSRHSSYGDLQYLMDRGDVCAIVVIPSKFSENLDKYSASVQVLIDGTDPNRATAASGYISVIAQDYIKELLRENDIDMTENLTEPVIRIWYNPSLKSKHSIVPGLIALIMAILSVLLTSSSISKEWEGSSMELLLSTPISKAELIVGKFIPYFIIGMIDCAILIFMGTVIYSVPIRGSLLLLFLVCSIFLTVVLLQGIAFSVLMKNSLTANLAALLSTFLPTMLLSGFVFYIPGMPWIIQYITNIVPAKYFILCTRGIYAKGIGPDSLSENIFILLLFAGILFTFVMVKLRKKID